MTVLLDVHGVGGINRQSEFVAAQIVDGGGRAVSTTSYPAMIRHRSASPLLERRHRQTCCAAQCIIARTGRPDIAPRRVVDRTRDRRFSIRGAATFCNGRLKRVENASPDVPSAYLAAG